MNTEQLIKDVQELKEWKRQHELQQFTYPIDVQSRNILNKDVLFYTGNTFTLTTSDLLSFGMEVIVDNKTYGLFASVVLKPVTADAGTDVLTTTSPHTFANNDIIAFGTSNTLPAPLDLTTSYYVINATALTFKVSLTSGGAAVNITDAGTGTHYVGKI